VLTHTEKKTYNNRKKEDKNSKKQTNSRYQISHSSKNSTQVKIHKFSLWQ